MIDWPYKCHDHVVLNTNVFTRVYFAMRNIQALGKTNRGLLTKLFPSGPDIKGKNVLNSVRRLNQQILVQYNGVKIPFLDFGLR